MRRGLSALSVLGLVVAVGCGDSDSGAPAPPSDQPPPSSTCQTAGTFVLPDASGARLLEAYREQPNPGELEIKQAAVLWATLASAALDEQFVPAWDVSLARGWFEGFARLYPKTFAPAYTCVQQPLKRPFTCEQGCAPTLRDLWDYFGQTLLSELNAALAEAAASAKIAELLQKIDHAIATASSTSSVLDGVTIGDARDLTLLILNAIGGLASAAALAGVAPEIMALAAGVAGIAAYALGFQKLVEDMLACKKWRKENCEFAGLYGTSVIAGEGSMTTFEGIRDSGRLVVAFDMHTTSYDKTMKAGTLAGTGRVLFDFIEAGQASAECRVDFRVPPTRRKTELTGTWKRIDPKHVEITMKPNPDRWEEPMPGTYCGHPQTSSTTFTWPGCNGTLANGELVKSEPRTQVNTYKSTMECKLYEMAR
ncbi:MAG: hypothetical protein KIT84_40020 [Labilithrix sp.]|nr:hypothetical protein [Labilithrix sp.]